MRKKTRRMRREGCEGGEVYDEEEDDEKKDKDED